MKVWFAFKTTFLLPCQNILVELSYVASKSLATPLSMQLPHVTMYGGAAMAPQESRVERRTLSHFDEARYADTTICKARAHKNGWLE